jgi:hypothetical protein
MRIHLTSRYLVAFVAICGLVPATPPRAAAQSFDGVYAGTISCGLSTDVNRVWESPFRMTVEDGKAHYERPILRDRDSTGVYERGGGTVTREGGIGLAGRADGATYVFDARYQGQITEKAARLVGTQLWYIRGKDGESERSCHIELIRVPSSS